MKMPAPPTINPTFFNEYIVRWQLPAKDGKRYQESGTVTANQDAAIKLFNHHTCLRVLYPLKSYAKQQEHLISVMQLGNAQRAKPMGKLHKLTSGLLSEPNLYPPDLSEILKCMVLPLLQESQPGQTSRYYPLYAELGKMICDFIRTHQKTDELTNKIPH